jgi:nucleoid-associated protein EbfC
LWPGFSTITTGGADVVVVVVEVGMADEGVLGGIAAVTIGSSTGVCFATGSLPHPATTSPITTTVNHLRTPHTVPDGTRLRSCVVANPTRGTAVQPGQPNMQQILQQAQKMQQQLVTAQEELADAEVTGTAGGGLVTAVVSGAGELKSLDIDPKAVDPEDTETLADLVVAAVRDANRAAQELAAQKMGPLAGGMGGMGDLGGLGGLLG